MQYPKDRNIHRPPHLAFGNIFFITGRCKNKNPYLKNSPRKKLFKRVLAKSANKFSIHFYAWVILDDHYHLLLKIRKNRDLAQFINNLHSNSSRLLNLLDRIPKRQIWIQYWDHSIRDETDFGKHFNYIHHNPVKHGVVSSQEVVSYKFCSYGDWVKKKGEDWLTSSFEQYPIIDFTTNE